MELLWDYVHSGGSCQLDLQLGGESGYVGLHQHREEAKQINRQAHHCAYT